MSSSATGVGMPICFLGAILLILTQKSSQKFGDVLGIMSRGAEKKVAKKPSCPYLRCFIFLYPPICSLLIYPL